MMTPAGEAILKKTTTRMRSKTMMILAGRCVVVLTE